MPRSRHATASKPHGRSKADKRIGQAAPSGDPWAARIREAIYSAYHEPQTWAANDNSRRISILTGRGAGKTTEYKGRFLDEMAHTTHGRYIYACPTLGMGIELMWEPLKQTLSQLGLEQGHDFEIKEAPREGGKILMLRTGSRLKLIGVDDKKQVNLCRGQPFNGVAGDEVSYWGIDLVKDFVENVIEPRIGERDGWIALASSPGKVLRGLFYDVTRDSSPMHRPYRDRDKPGFENWRRTAWSSHAWNLAEVTGVFKAGDAPYPAALMRYPALVALRQSHLEIKATKGWSDQNPVWLREYEGRWSRDDTAAVFQFDPAKNLWCPQKYDEQRKVFRDKADAIEGLALLKRAIAALPPGHEWHFVVGADKGSPRISKDTSDDGERERRDPWAFNVYAFSPSDPEQRILHTYFLERTGLYARPIAQLLLGEDPSQPNGVRPHDSPGGILGIIGWPDGMVADCDPTTLKELAEVYGLRFDEVEKRPAYKAGAIELTNGGLVDARIKAIEDSPLHHQLAELQWAEQDSGALKEDPSQPNHSSDTLIYARLKIEKLFETGVVVREATPTPGYSDPMGLDGPRPEPPPQRSRKPERGTEGLFEDWLSDQSEDDFL